jgi:hypothetical protein
MLVIPLFQHFTATMIIIIVALKGAVKSYEKASFVHHSTEI